MPEQDEKEASALVTLYEHLATQFDQRRSHEWRMTFALWTGIGIFTVFVAPHQIPRDFLETDLKIIYALIAGIYTRVWALPLARKQIALEKKKQAIILAISKVFKLEGLGDKEDARPYYWDFAVWFKALITIILLFFSYQVLSFPSVKGTPNVSVTLTEGAKTVEVIFPAGSEAKKSIEQFKQDLSYADKLFETIKVQ